MPDSEIGWGIKVDEIWEGNWSIGACLSHGFDETYLFINFFKWSISIGKIRKPVEDEQYEGY